MKQLFQDRGSAAVVQGSSLTYVTPLCLSHPISCLLSAVPSNKATKKTPKQQQQMSGERAFLDIFVSISGNTAWILM